MLEELHYRHFDWLGASSLGILVYKLSGVLETLRYCQFDQLGASPLDFLVYYTHIYYYLARP